MDTLYHSEFNKFFFTALILHFVSYLASKLSEYCSRACVHNDVESLLLLECKGNATLLWTLTRKHL
jgi:hypothetical protein